MTQTPTAMLNECATTEGGSPVRRVLIIDDDAELGELLGEYLANEGFVLEFAHDGNTGLRRALTGGYALVILDVMLPGLNGFEVLRQLRTQSPVPVLMLTARGDDVDRIVGLEIGADDYLPSHSIRGNWLPAFMQFCGGCHRMRRARIRMRNRCRLATWSWIREPAWCGAVVKSLS